MASPSARVHPEDDSKHSKDSKDSGRSVQFNASCRDGASRVPRPKKMCVVDSTGSDRTGSERKAEPVRSLSSRLMRSASSSRRPPSPTPTLTVEHEERSGLVIDPEARLHAVWSSVMLAAIGCNMFLVPFRIAFVPFEGSADALWLVGTSCDVLYLIDIVLAFNSGYHENGNKVMMRAAIMRQYVANLVSLRRRSFLQDVLSTLPIDWLEFLEHHRGVLRLNRLIRCSRALLILHELLDRRLGRHTAQVVQLVFILMMQIHLIACTWYVFGVVEGFGSNAWLPSAELAYDSSLIKQFIASIYQALALSIGVVDSGRPETTAEAIMHTVVMVLSLIMFAYAIGVVSSIEETANERALQYQAQLQYVRQVLRKHQMPPQVLHRVQNYLGYTNRYGERFSLGIVNELPEGLRADLLSLLFRRRLLAVPALAMCERVEGFVSTLLTHLVPAVFMRDEVLIPRGERPGELYFVLFGRASVQDGEGVEQNQLVNGDFCGEQVFYQELSDMLVKASTPCECMALRAATIEEVLQHYPTAKPIIEKARFLKEEDQTPDSKGMRKQRVSITAITDRLAGIIGAPVARKSMTASPPPSPPCTTMVRVSDAQQRVWELERELCAARQKLAVEQFQAEGRAPSAATTRRATVRLSTNSLARARVLRSGRFLLRPSLCTATSLMTLPGDVARESRRPHCSPPPSPPHAESQSPPMVQRYQLSGNSAPGSSGSSGNVEPDLEDMEVWDGKAADNDAHSSGRWCNILSQLPLIAPHSNARRRMLEIVLIVSAYTIVVLPLRFGYIREQHLLFKLLDVFSDVVFLVDTLAHFSLTYYQNFHLVRNRQQIARKHLRSVTLYVNLLSVLPCFPCIVTAYEEPLVRLSLLVRAFQVPFLGLDYVNAKSRSPLGLVADAHYSTSKLVLLAYVFLIMSHYCACFFAAIAPDTLPLDYSFGMWWTVTALTGFGTIPTLETVPQLLFASFVLSGSLFTSTYIIGNMGVLISNLDPVGVRFRMKSDSAERFVHHNAVTQDLSDRLHVYLRLVWTRGAGTNLSNVVSQMNANLRKDIMHQVCYAVFITVPMFASLGPRLVNSLIESMVMEVFPQHEWICHKGSISSAMYIVVEGSVSIVIDEERMIVVKRLSRGDFFGERSLFGSERRNASIQAKTTVEVVVLSAKTFRRMLKDPLILAENPMLLEEMRKIEAAKLLREQEMAAANNAVDEFRRVKSAPETTRKSFSTMLNKKKEGRGSKGESRDSTRECADSKAGSSADADDSFVEASHSKVNGDDLSDAGQASEASSWIKIRSGLMAMKNLKDKLTEVAMARSVSGPHTPSCTDEPANPCPPTNEGK